MQDSKYPDKKNPYQHACVECKHLRSEPYNENSCKRADIITFSREFGKRLEYCKVEDAIEQCEEEYWFEPDLWHSVLAKLKSLNKCEVISLMLIAFVIALILVL